MSRRRTVLQLEEPQESSPYRGLLMTKCCFIRINYSGQKKKICVFPVTSKKK